MRRTSLRFRPWVLAVMAAAAVTGTATLSFAAGWLRDVDAGLRSAQESQRPLVIYVSMDGCKYCQKMAQETLGQSTIQRALGNGFVTVAIKNSDRPDLIKQLQIRSFPTTLLVTSDGQVVDQLKGYVEAGAFQQRLQAAWQQNQALAQGTQPPAPVQSARRPSREVQR